jgi:hypothetical protein
MISRYDFKKPPQNWMYPDGEALGASVLIPKGYELEMFSDLSF